MFGPYRIFYNIKYIRKNFIWPKHRCTPCISRNDGYRLARPTTIYQSNKRTLKTWSQLLRCALESMHFWLLDAKIPYHWNYQFRLNFKIINHAIRGHICMDHFRSKIGKNEHFSPKNGFFYFFWNLLLYFNQFLT